MTAQLQVQAVLKQRLELEAQQAALGQHPAVALDTVPEIPLKGGAGDDHRLTEQGPHLGAADVEHVGQPGQVGEIHIVSGAASP